MTSVASLTLQPKQQYRVLQAILLRALDPPGDIPELPDTPHANASFSDEPCSLNLAETPPSRISVELVVVGVSIVAAVVAGAVVEIAATLSSSVVARAAVVAVIPAPSSAAAPASATMKETSSVVKIVGFLKPPTVPSIWASTVIVSAAERSVPVGHDAGELLSEVRGQTAPKPLPPSPLDERYAQSESG